MDNLKQQGLDFLLLILFCKIAVGKYNKTPRKLKSSLMIV